MKKKCERTRKALPDFLRGHVFRITRNRIERHLEQCAICKSECDTLRHVEETRQLLQDIDAPEGVGHRVREGVFAITKLKKILYRPLWLVGIALAFAGAYYYAMLPRQLDIEIENIVRTAPVITSSTPSAALKNETNAVTAQVKSVQAHMPQSAPAPAVQPLAVSITPGNETSAIRRINGVMGEHGQLRKMKFSDTEREISGKLTAPELLTFFDRIREVSKVRYDRKRFRSFPVAQQIPFVLTLKAAPKAVETPLSAQEQLKSAETHTPAATKASAPPVPAQ